MRLYCTIARSIHPPNQQRQNPLTAQEQVALCRCGASSNKPFCDGAHAQAGFEATERAPE
ncbi:MAG: hypothetical protein F6K11_07395, partial [Leptolyngbya sp. SIO3F4]|nr:hypothetical protein [Leptolyngbya sp. SIO3F4]